MKNYNKITGQNTVSILGLIYNIEEISNTQMTLHVNTSILDFNVEYQPNMISCYDYRSFKIDFMKEIDLYHQRDVLIYHFNYYNSRK